MSYEERGQWVYVIVTVVAVATYVVLLVAGAGGGPLTEVDYVPIMLWTIGAGIVGVDRRPHPRRHRLAWGGT